MRLNKNSLTPKLYKWFYGVDEYKGLPTNLCPYFWKVVLMYLTIIPYTLFSIPVVIYDLLDKQYENGDRKTGERLGVSFGVYIGIVIVSALIMAIVGLFVTFEPKSFLEHLMVGGTIFWVFLIIIGIIEGIKYLREYVTSDDSYYDETQDKWVVKRAKINLTTEFIKAKYHKYCPKLEWFGNDDRS